MVTVANFVFVAVKLYSIVRSIVAALADDSPVMATVNAIFHANSIESFKPRSIHGTSPLSTPSATSPINPDHCAAVLILLPRYSD